MTTIRVAHVGAFDASTVNGVTTSAWYLAGAEVGAGGTVYLYSLGRNSRESHLATGAIKRDFVPSSRLGLSRSLCEWLTQNLDDLHVVHLHSVFIPLNNQVAAACRRARIPYVLTPNGGYDRHVFDRHPLKKWVYYSMVERFLIAGASGVHCVSPQECEDVRRLGFRSDLLVAPNLFGLDELLTVERFPGRSIVWLGRWDVRHKGLDRLLQIWSGVSRSDRTLELHLYGNGRERHKVERLISRLVLPRVVLHEPVYGQEKNRVLGEALVYVQPSRWEVFGVSVAEAMAAGVPVAVSKGCCISERVVESGCGVVLSEDDTLAAHELVELANRSASQYAALCRNARRYAASEFDPGRVARRMLDFYRKLAEPTRRQSERPIDRAGHRDCGAESVHEAPDLDV